MTALGEVLRQAKDPVRVDDPAQAKLISVKLHGQGAVRRTVGDGKAPKPFTGNRGRAGQFVFSRIWARRGAMALVPDELDGVVVTSEFPLFDVDSTRLDARYLNRYVQTPSFLADLDRVSAGASGQNRVKEAAFLGLDVPLPPLPEQRRIAAILDHADALRTKRRQVLTHLDSLVESVFHQMFDMQRDHLPFAATCHRITVGVVIKPASHYVETGVPALRTLNVKPGRIVLDDLVYFSEASNNGPLAKSRLRAGDLVIARTGKAGTTAIVPAELDGANAIDLIVATPNTDVALPVYLEALLNSETGKRMVSGEARGQIQQHFNVGSLKATSVAVPPLSLQHGFAQRVELINRQRAILNDAALNDAALFAALRVRAFRGQL